MSIRELQMVAMYSKLDPWDVTGFIYSRLSLVIPPSPPPVNLNQGERKCELRERGVVKTNHDLLHTISVPPSCEESGHFPSPFLFGRAPLPPNPIPDRVSWQCRAGRPLGPHPAPPPLHTQPHSGSQLPPIWIAFAGGVSFSPTRHPPPLLLAVHSMIWHVFSFFPLSSFSFFSFEYAGWCGLHLWGQQLLTKQTLTLE